MAGLLNEKVVNRVDEFAKSFAAADPFRHVVMDDFFESEFCGQILRDFPDFRDDVAKNEMGGVGNKAVHEHVRDLGPVFSRLDDYIQSREFLNVIETVSGIPGLKYDPYYVGGGTHENRSGQELDPHVDFNYHPHENWHRRLNLIVYLNPEWSEEWGGSIELHSDPWNPETNQIKSILPLVNRAVLFETNEHSWHGFKPVNKDPEGGLRSRRSFAIYLYTEDRPEAEVAPPHGTKYVQRPLPAHLQPGYTLTEGDQQQLNRLFRKRDGWLKYMYERELDYSAQLERGKVRIRELEARLENLEQGSLLLSFLKRLAPPGSKRRNWLKSLAQPKP